MYQWWRLWACNPCTCSVEATKLKKKPPCESKQKAIYMWLKRFTAIPCWGNTRGFSFAFGSKRGDDLGPRTRFIIMTAWTKHKQNGTGMIIWQTKATTNFFYKEEERKSYEAIRLMICHLRLYDETKRNHLFRHVYSLFLFSS